MLSASRPMRTAVGMAAAALLVAPLAACSGGSGDDGTAEIVWSTWGTPEELSRVQELTDQFTADNTDIAVTLEPVASYGDYHSKLLAQLTSGTAPDVFYIGDDYLGQFVDAGVLHPLSDLMSSEASETAVDDFFPGIFGVAEQDGEIYAAPNDVNPDALWYDKEALAAAGITQDPAELAAAGDWTTEAFLAMSDALADAGLTAAMFWNYWATHYSWIASQGGAAYDDAGAFVADQDPTSVAALDEFAQRFQSGQFVIADTLPEGAGADSLFVTHQAGFFAQGRYTIGTITSAGVADSYDIVRWPTPDGVEAPTGVAASYLAINKDTENLDAAFRFWTAFLSADGQTFRLGGGGNAVPSIVGADEVVLEGGIPPHAETFLGMRDIGFANHPAEAAVPGLSSDISELMLALYQGKSDAQATLAEVAALVEAETAS